MADTANSTPAPSRRAFFGSAVGAGWAAAQPAIFTAAAASDAVLLAMVPVLDGIADSLRTLEREADRIDGICIERVGPPPVKPVCHRDVFPTFAEFDAAMDRWQDDLHAHDARMVALANSMGLAGIVAARSSTKTVLRSSLARFAETRATSLEGLAAKARVADAHASRQVRDSVAADVLTMHRNG